MLLYMILCGVSKPSLPLSRSTAQLEKRRFFFFFATANIKPNDPSIWWFRFSIWRRKFWKLPTFWQSILLWQLGPTLPPTAIRSTLVGPQLRGHCFSSSEHFPKFPLNLPAQCIIGNWLRMYKYHSLGSKRIVCSIVTTKNNLKHENSSYYLEHPSYFYEVSCFSCYSLCFCKYIGQPKFRASLKIPFKLRCQCAELHSYQVLSPLLRYLFAPK